MVKLFQVWFNNFNNGSSIKVYLQISNNKLVSLHIDDTVVPWNYNTGEHYRVMNSSSNRNILAFEHIKLFCAVIKATKFPVCHVEIEKRKVLPGSMNYKKWY